MTSRTPPPPDTPFDMSAEPPAGHRWELQPDKDWALAEGMELTRKCRRPGCPALAVASLRRSHRGRKHGQWWLYCADHLYGRVIVGGTVMVRRAVPEDAPPWKPDHDCRGNCFGFNLAQYPACREHQTNYRGECPECPRCPACALEETP